MRVRILLVVAVLALLAVSGAWADIVQTLTYGPAGTDWTHNFVFNQFDPSGGTLTGVRVDVTGDLSGWIRAFNSTLSAADFTGSQTANMYVMLGSTPLVLLSARDSCIAGDTPFDSAWQTQWTLVPATSWSPTHTSSATDTDSWTASNLAPWIGTGTITLGSGANGGINVVGPGIGNAEWQTLADATVTVTYDTSSIPEPCTLALSALGLAGMGLLRKRRAKK